MPVGERVVLREDCDRRTIGAAERGAKGGCHPADSGLDWKSQFARFIAQQSGGEMLLEFGLGLFVNLMADCDRLFLVAIDRAANFIVCVHGGNGLPPLSSIVAEC